MATLTPRGFADFCDFRDSYGSRVIVRQSSNAEIDAVWIFAKDNPDMKNPAPHLTVEQATIVRDGLDDFIRMAAMDVGEVIDALSANQEKP